MRELIFFFLLCVHAKQYDFGILHSEITNICACQLGKSTAVIWIKANWINKEEYMWSRLVQQLFFSLLNLFPLKSFYHLLLSLLNCINHGSILHWDKATEHRCPTPLLFLFLLTLVAFVTLWIIFWIIKKYIQLYMWDEKNVILHPLHCSLPPITSNA